MFKLKKLRGFYKSEMNKHAKGDPIYNRYNQLQNMVKIYMNAMYGDSGNKSSPYFNR